MATLICGMASCKHRSNMPLRSYVRRGGGKLYGCTLDAVMLQYPYDPDGDLHALMGDCGPMCKDYARRTHDYIGGRRKP